MLWDIFAIGGAIGISPVQAGLYGLSASFLTMALGHLIGQYFARLSKASLGSREKKETSDDMKKGSVFSDTCSFMLDPLLASGSLLGILALLSLQEVILT